MYRILQKEALSKPEPRPTISRTKPPTKPLKDMLSPPSTPQTIITPVLADDASQSQDSEAAFWQTPAAVPDRVLHFTDREGTESAEGSFNRLNLVRLAKTINEDNTSLGIDNSLEYEGDGEETVVMKHPPPVSSPTEPNPPAPIIDKPPLPVHLTPPKIKLNSETERIVVSHHLDSYAICLSIFTSQSKIWSTVGEIIMPGHPFDASGKSTNKPPNAKETMAHLQSISSQSPSPTSPSAASLSSISAAPNPPSGQPTTQQILTAHLLLTLLSFPPDFSMPLNKLKEALSNKINGDGAAFTNLLGGQVTTRALYVCVAKKLVKIERGGKEQVVKFDV